MGRRASSWPEILFFDNRVKTDIIRIRIENPIQRRLFELDRVSSSDFIDIWKSKILDLEKFWSKIFFYGNDLKLIPYDSYAQTEAHDTVLEWIGQVLTNL